MPFLISDSDYHYHPLYRFYGWEHAGEFPPVRECACKNIGECYLRLLSSWSIDTCSERFRPLWSEENPTAGQCTITAALVHEFFGGEVLHLPLPEGGFHSFNRLNGIIIDLACEQFGKDALLDFAHAAPADPAALLASPDKLARYELLKKNFLAGV